MNQSIRKVMILFFMMIGVLSFNPDKVSAESCEYGAICTYTACIKQKGSFNFMGFEASANKCSKKLIGTDGADINFTANYKCMNGDSKKASECKSFKSWADFSVGGNETKDAIYGGMDNYSDIFYNADKFKNKFINSNQYTCPDFWMEATGNYSYNLYYEEHDNSTRVSGTLQCVAKGESDEETDSKANDSNTSAYKDEFTDEDKAKIQNYYKNSSNSRNYSDDVDSCSLISGDVQTLLHDVFLYICVAGIIILVVMTMINLIKVITGADENLLRNFLKSLITRIICLIILLILPSLVTFVIQVINGQASAFGFNSSNPLCGITKK